MQRQSKSILVVEDDRSMRGLLELILRREDRSILLARDGAEAPGCPGITISTWRSWTCTCPGVNGATFCRAHRERGGDAPVVMLSAATDGPAQAPACAAKGVSASRSRS